MGDHSTSQSVRKIAPVTRTNKRNQGNPKIILKTKNNLETSRKLGKKLNQQDRTEEK